MNRLLLLSCFFFPILCYGQGYGLCMQVVANTGGSGTQGNYSVSWTVGELVTATLTGTDHKVTQGFHQPDVCTPVSTWNPDLESLGIEIFPNPCTSFLSIRYTDSGNSSLGLEIFDVLGHRVQQPMRLDLPEGTLIDASAWQPGIYFLQIKDNFSNSTATLRVVRL